MNRKNPCFTCAGGVDCATCINSPENSTPVKLYTPKGAARAMLAGKVLKGRFGMDHFWGKNEWGEIGFFCRNNNEKCVGKLLVNLNFSGLWEEL